MLTYLFFKLGNFFSIFNKVYRNIHLRRARWVCFLNVHVKMLSVLLNIRIKIVYTSKLGNFFFLFSTKYILVTVFNTFFYRKRITFWIHWKHAPSWFINVWTVLMGSHVMRWWVQCMLSQGFIFHKKPSKKQR